MVWARPSISSSDTRWQVWQEAETSSSGLLTWWSLPLKPHCTQTGDSSAVTCIESMIGRWHLAHDWRAIRRFAAVARIGWWEFPVVKASEWFQPFTALVTYLPTAPFGVWQSLQVATA